MNRERRPLPALTGLRFFLAIWVVIFHLVPGTPGLRIPWLPGAPAGLSNLLRTGYVAVTIFFVLSGFVLAYNYDLGRAWSRQDRSRFAVARFTRIYPAYFIGLVSLVPVAVYRAWQGIEAGEYSLRSGLLNLVLMQAWWPHAALSWNYPGWSLACEAFYYASFPALGILLWRLKRRATLLATIGSLWGLAIAAPLATVLIPVRGFGDVAASGGAPAAAAGFWVSLVSYNPLAGWPAFLSGVALARLYRTLPSDSRWFGRGGWLSIPSAALIVAILSMADRLPLPLVHNGLLLPLYLALVLGLALEGGLLAKILAVPALIFLGNASYAMYILHFPIGEWLLLSSIAFLEHTFDGLGWVFFYTFTVIVVSSVFYRWVEEPLHRRLRQALTAQAPGSAQLAGGQRSY